MVGRGDRRHDIAAWFGLNQGRIAEVEDGTHGSPLAASAGDLPPEGSPGPRARVMRSVMDQILKALADGKSQRAEDLAKKAIKDFDAPV